MHDGISHYRESSHNGTLTDGNQYITVFAKLLQCMDIFFVAASTLYQAYMTALFELLQVVQGRPAKLSQFQQVQDPLVNIEE